MLEVQNQALLKSAGERTQRISDLERELQQAGEALKWLRAEVERLKTEGQRLKAEVGRLKAEHEFYHSRVLTLERDNRELTEAVIKYSLWGQKLERELAQIDPDGASARRFGAEHEP